MWKSTSVSGAPDNSSLSHFSAMTWPRWLGRAARNRHRHVKQASRRKILISTQAATPGRRPSARTTARGTRPPRRRCCGTCRARLMKGRRATARARVAAGIRPSAARASGARANPGGDARAGCRATALHQSRPTGSAASPSWRPRTPCGSPRARASAGCRGLCGNQNFTTRRLLDVAMSVPRRSTEPARPRHRREMT